MFADDANIHAQNIDNLRLILAACEHWSLKNNMEFAPAKCVYMGPSADPRLTLYGEQVPSEESYKYLGIWFNQEGIQAEKTIIERTTKGKGVTELLGAMGLNPTGWAYDASVTMYRAFIRPTFEYGLALMDTKHVKPLDKTQAQALRRITGGARSDSVASMAKYLSIEPMKHRVLSLNANFALRLHDNNDRTMPASVIWRNGLQGNNKNSIVFMTVRKNPYWTRFDKKTHLGWPLRVPRIANKGGAFPAAPRVVNPVTYRNPNAGLKVKNMLKMVSLEAHKGSIADVIPIDLLKKRKIMKSGKKISRRDRVTITRWRIGNFCKHQTCCNCEAAELSRKHGCECSGAKAYIIRTYPALAQTIELGTISAIDALLNHVDQSANRADHQRAAHAIGLVAAKCRHLEQTRNHFWRPRDGTDIQPARWNRQHEQHIVIQQGAPARPAFQRNVPRGRRPRQPRDPNPEAPQGR
jgi:hypothetical protein